VVGGGEGKNPGGGKGVGRKGGVIKWGGGRTTVTEVVAGWGGGVWGGGTMNFLNLQREWWWCG